MEVYLEGGPRPAEGADALPSTIVDATAVPLRVVRQGAISLERLREVVPSVLGMGEEPEADQDVAADAAEPGEPAHAVVPAEPAEPAVNPEPAESAEPAERPSTGAGTA